VKKNGVLLLQIQWGSTVRKITGINGDRIVIRNRWTFDPSMEVSEQRVSKFGNDQDKSFNDRFPMLSDVEMEYRWAGRLCLSLNSVPAFGEVDKIFIQLVVKMVLVLQKAP